MQCYHTLHFIQIRGMSVWWVMTFKGRSVILWLVVHFPETCLLRSLRPHSSVSVLSLETAAKNIGDSIVRFPEISCLTKCFGRAKGYTRHSRCVISQEGGQMIGYLHLVKPSLQTRVLLNWSLEFLPHYVCHSALISPLLISANYGNRMKLSSTRETCLHISWSSFRYGDRVERNLVRLNRSPPSTPPRRHYGINNVTILV